MSATGRGAVRAAQDFYQTPAYTTRALFRHLADNEGPMEGDLLLEPAAGEGALIKAACGGGWTRPSQWVAVELDNRPTLAGTEHVTWIQGCDFLKEEGLPQFDWAITNPPFSLTMEFIAKMRKVATNAIILQRINFLGSLKRLDFWRGNMPGKIYLLSQRPKFIPGESGDATEYAFYHWRSWDVGRRDSEIEVLPPEET